MILIFAPIIPLEITTDASPICVVDPGFSCIPLPFTAKAAIYGSLTYWIFVFGGAIYGTHYGFTPSLPVGVIVLAILAVLLAGLSATVRGILRAAQPTVRND